MEIVVVPTIYFVKSGILIGSITNFDYGLKGVSTRRNLSRSSGIPVAIIGVVATPHMVFTNPIMITHVNKTTDRPLMNSMVTRRYISIDVGNLGKGYQKPSVVTTKITNNKNGHSMKPNMVTLKYPNFKKVVDPNIHVKVFNFVVKANAKTFEEYIINAFNNMLKDIALDWCHNYMSKFPDYNFLELTQAFCKCHQKTQNDKKNYI
jgi:hypothetical protein